MENCSPGESVIPGCAEGENRFSKLDRQQNRQRRKLEFETSRIFCQTRPEKRVTVNEAVEIKLLSCKDQAVHNQKLREGLALVLSRKGNESCISASCESSYNEQQKLATTPLQLIPKHTPWHRKAHQEATHHR